MALAGLATDESEHVLGTEQEPARLELEAAVDLTVVADHLEIGRPYRLEWNLRPEDDSKPMAQGTLPIEKNHGGKASLVLSAPRNWTLRCRVLGLSQGHGPKFLFNRPNAIEPLFLSTQTTWEDLDPVTAFRDHRVLRAGGRLYLQVQRRIDISGVVLGLPYYPEPDKVSIAAITSTGSWYSTISGNGWFQFQRIPADSYKIVVYERESSRQTKVEIHKQGTVRAQLEIDLSGPKHDIELSWEQPEKGVD